jgi:hypothetical protein
MLIMRDELPNRSDKNNTAIKNKPSADYAALAVFSLNTRHKV